MRYDELAQRIAALPAHNGVRLVAVDGCGGAGKTTFAFIVWVDAPRDIRLDRGIERDGAAAAGRWAVWMAAEDEYVARDKPIDRADLIVDGSALTAAPDRSFVVRD